MPRKKTKFLFLILSLLVVVSMGFFVFLLSFTNNLIIDSVDKEGQIKKELTRQDSLILMKDTLVTAKQYQDQIMGYAIPAGGTVDFIKDLEQLVSNAGIKSDIKSVSSEKYDKGDSMGLELVRVKMDVIGEWKNVDFFLTLLENYPLKIDINDISLNKFSDYVVGKKTIPEWSGNFEFTVVKIKDNK